MPQRPPLIADPRIRSAVVALLMLALLGASLAAAALVSARRISHSDSLTNVQLPALTLRVPQGWQPVPQGQLPGSLHGARVLAEPVQKGRVLVILPLGSAPGAQLTDALQAALQRLIPPVVRQSLQGATRLWRAPKTHGLLYMGLSLQDMHKHYLAVLTADDQRFWAVYLSGPFRSSTRDLRQMNLELAGDRQLLQTVLESAAPAPRS
jgi:hypothetical protein